MMRADHPRSPLHRRPLLLAALALGSLLFCYGLALLVSPDAPKLNFTFNDMLARLLTGRFDIDPAVVGREGFTLHGRTYAYWGVLPALLRLPMLVLPGWRQLDFTIPYSILAIVLMAAIKLWTLRRIVEACPSIPPYLARACGMVLLLSGAQVCFLRFSLYQEVCLWAELCAALFVAAAISAALHGLGRRILLVLAGAAGAAMLARVSTGIGLVAALGAVLLIELVRRRRDLPGYLKLAAGPVLLLALLGLATAGVNYARWGNPLTFADYQHYNYNLDYPDRLVRTARYGLFSVERIPFGIVYYFFPVWAFQGPDGTLMLDAMRERLIDSAELPPSSFLLTDALLLWLGAGAVRGWWRGGTGDRVQAIAVAAGLAIPALLMLMAISMCFRYRLDFYPLIEFLAFSGLIAAGRGGTPPAARTVRFLAAVSILSSILVGTLYAFTKLGPGQLLIRHGIVPYFLGMMGIA